MKFETRKVISYFALTVFYLTGEGLFHSGWASQGISGWDFTRKIFHSFSQSNDRNNVIVSPYATSMAMGLLAYGAKGETAKQLNHVQAWTLRPEAFSRFWIANRLWVQKDYPLLKGYVEGSNRNFGEIPWRVDFTKAPDFLSNRVNEWIEEKTANQVKNFMSFESIDPTMKMLLSSVAFFRGNWAFPIDRSATREEAFTYSRGKSVTVPIMHFKGNFRHKKLNDFQILELPYSEKDLVMDIFLPDSADGLESVESALNSMGIEALLSEMSIREMNVALPKWAMGDTLDFTELFKSLGVVDAFTPELADFRGMTKERELYLSKIYHKSLILVHEEGTTVTSSNNFVLRKPASEPESLTLNADHPFLFLIWNRATKVMLFIGQLIKP